MHYSMLRSGRLRRFLLLLVAIQFGCESNQEVSSDTKSCYDHLIEAIDFDNPSQNDVQNLILLFHSDSDAIVNKAIATLERIGQPAVPRLVEELRRGNTPEMQTCASQALERIGPSAIPILLKKLNNPSYDKSSIYEVLGGIRPTSKEVIDALSAAIGDKNLHQESALREIYNLRLEAEAAHAVDDLIPLIRHPDKKIAMLARAALWDIDLETAWNEGLRDGPHNAKLIDNSR